MKLLLVLLAMLILASCAKEDASKTALLVNASSSITIEPSPPQPAASPPPAAVQPSTLPTSPSAAPQQPAPLPEQPLLLTQGQNISLRTSDGISLAANWYPGGEKAVLLLHMLGKDKASWKPLIPSLQKAGYSVLAIDLRGHGQSGLDWKDFSSAMTDTKNEFLNMRYDVRAAEKFLRKEKKNHYAIIGASIGANIALGAAIENENLSTVVLLSPGFNYRGVDITAAPQQYQRAVLLVTASEDAYSRRTVEALSKRFHGRRKSLSYPGSAHGTDILDAYPELSDKISAWIQEEDRPHDN